MYLEWNNALAAHFFRREASGRPVYLYVNPELVLRLHRQLGTGKPDFISAVKDGPPWVTRQGICQKALQTFEGWRRRHFHYPPYIGYLSLFVLAAGTSGDWAPHAYYPRLWQLLGEDRIGMVPSFDKIVELWEDLERWSVEDKSGELGMFRARSAGSMIHVGYPIGQTILTEEERAHLPQVFSAAALDPTSPPSESRLARIILQYGGSHLRASTRRLLQSRSDTEAFLALMDVLEQELVDWDGHAEDIRGSAELKQPPGALLEHPVGIEVAGTHGLAGLGQQPRVHGALRLCICYDEVAAQAQATFRCRLNRDFPEDDIVLSIHRQLAAFVCREYLAGWSTQLQFEDESGLVDAGSFDWTNDVVLDEKRLGWQFRLPGGSIRLLTIGGPEGLPGLVEVHALLRDQPLYLLFRDEVWRWLEHWAQVDCSGFKELSVRSGLPRGWRLAQVAGVSSDERVRDAFPILSFSHLVKLSFRNGLRSSPHGNSFFAFAPPELVVDGGDGTEEVVCNGKLLRRSAASWAYQLPSTLPVDSRITVEVRQSDRLIKAQSLYLTSGVDWSFGEPVEEFDQWGNIIQPSNGRTHVSGAVVKDQLAGELPFARSPLLTKGIRQLGGSRLFLLGRCPGQISSWPDEPLPSAWHPVWAVIAGRRSRAIYCGDEIASSTPFSVGGEQDKDRRHLWVDVLWHRRKRITPPEEPCLRRLWKDFQEAARRV